MVISFYKDANNERKYFGLALNPDKKRMQEYLESSPEMHQEDIEDFIESQEGKRGI